MSMASGLRKRRAHLFVQVPSETIRDKRLSFRARGLLAYLLDMPDGWDVKSEWLAEQGPEGRFAVRSALTELGDLGYYRLERRRLLNGQFAMGTAVSEDPVESWVAERHEYDGGPVPVIEQSNGTFQVKHIDGSLSLDEFSDESASLTGDRFPDAGVPGSGSTVALSSNHKRDIDEEPTTLLSVVASATPDEQMAEAKNDREDVIGLCERLADWIKANGSKKPPVTKAWRDAARLMLDAESRPLTEVEAIIDWCQADDFWRGNILSMPTFRKQYDRLRLKRDQEAKKKSGGMDWDRIMVESKAKDKALGWDKPKELGW